MKGQITEANNSGKPGFWSCLGIFTCRLRSCLNHRVLSMYPSHMTLGGYLVRCGVMDTVPSLSIPASAGPENWWPVSLPCSLMRSHPNFDTLWLIKKGLGVTSGAPIPWSPLLDNGVLKTGLLPKGAFSLVEMIVKERFPSSSFAPTILGGEKSCFKMCSGSRLWWWFGLKGWGWVRRVYFLGVLWEFLVLFVHTVLLSPTVFTVRDF